ncbi:MAG: OmpA family protein [Bacteroidota bacterium]
MRKLFQIIGILLISSHCLLGQMVELQGFVYETNNRGYLNQAKATIYDQATNAIKQTVYTNIDGVFTTNLAIGQNYRITIEKDLFVKYEFELSTVNKQEGEKLFSKIEMTRKPGYIFDVTVANKRKKGQEVVDAISGALIEVYNNTQKKEVLVLKDYPHPSFKTTFEQGNHYTVMIRKQGYFNKRMEAFVNIEGCILCFEGVGTVQPGVSDVLTEGHQMGTLLANVELEPLALNQTIKIENIYYDLNKADIRPDAAKELDKLVNLLKNNPSLIVELGSHTDSRGRDSYNMRLSQKRAKSAVAYITEVGGIAPARIKGKGYGETKLVNRCKNDVKCSERRHQENRRTELKIVGFSEEDSYASKSLAQIIEEEEFEKMLKEVENSEVIQLKPGEAPPPSTQPSEAPVATTPAPQDDAPQFDTPIITSSPPPAASTPDAQPSSIFSEGAAADEATTAADSLTTDIRKSQPMTPDRKISKSQPVQPQQATADGSEDFADSKIVNELEVKVAAPRGNVVSLPPGYSGYRIEFFNSSYELPPSHEIFKKHGEITVEMKKDGSYAYLLGDFADWRDANKFLNSIMLSQYPNASVVRYKKGNRLRS